MNILTNRYEVMAFAAESRSLALGSVPGVVTLDRNVDLARTLNRIWPVAPSGHSYGDHKLHSAEFRQQI
ncbi:MAG: hypothetical protein JWM68_1285 [Verrucomicrobiales bacterium]|nr:hypothetical protein [Verrucomicrobiales bacterium]